MAPPPKKKKKQGKQQTPEQRIQAEHRSLVRSIFRGAGFKRITGVSDKTFTYNNQQTDIDDVFIFENVILCFEYTVSKSENVGAHLKGKKIFYDKVAEDGSALIDFLKLNFPDSADQFPKIYDSTKYVVKIVYCSRYQFDGHYKENVPGPAFLDYPAARYFSTVVDAIKLSARHELLHFLGIPSCDVGNQGKFSASVPSEDYPGSILPEHHSKFDKGFKVVSFYADPEALLRAAYVLRNDGWRDSLNLYQRMISKPKIEAIRTYLHKEKRVFINNIIVTLPADVKPVSSDGTTIDPSKLTATAPVKIKLPTRPNSVGLIDGQHRVFAYYESEVDDPEIALLRRQQNLLVTGIIYPATLSDAEREKFEARLFLEINSTQTSAKAPLKQAIGMVLDPFASESIAARVLSGLATKGPLAGYVQQYFYDTEKLKTASIVSFGLKPLVKTMGYDSLFAIWPEQKKQSVADQTDLDLLNDYVEFCVSKINRFLASIRRNLASARWATSNKVEGRVLATTYVNSFLIAMRLLIARSHSLDPDDVDKSFDGLDGFNFSVYHSSQYARMADKMIDLFFPHTKEHVAETTP